MKKLKYIFVALFFMVLLVPLLNFNFKDNVISEIDNRKLMNNPFGKNYVAQDGIRRVDALRSYASDRIGFRNDMINIYTIANDKIFDEMIHPSYEYGKDGYIFLKLNKSSDYTEYHKNFAAMVKDIQQYCEDRNVPFVFVFDPSKNTVMQEYLPDGVNYQADWTKAFFAELDRLNVNYVDNTKVMIEMKEKGECVYNKKYNAGHWNDLGAFYGMNAVLDNLQHQGVNVELNSMDDFVVKKKLNLSLPVSKFKIKEYEPYFVGKKETKYVHEQYNGEVKINESFPTFSYSINDFESVLDSPKTLVFQGSYVNGMGYKFLANSLREYIAVHDYQNVLNFPYYFNIFKPECVIFEVAEFTFSDSYFSSEGIKNFKLNPEISTLKGYKEKISMLDKNKYSIENGKKLSMISVDGIIDKADYVYLKVNDEIFDLSWDEEAMAWTADIEKDKMNKSKARIIAFDIESKIKYIYHFS